MDTRATYVENGLLSLIYRKHGNVQNNDYQWQSLVKLSSINDNQMPLFEKQNFQNFRAQT